MDPVSNSLLRTFECSTCDLHRFTSSSWEPPVKLTTHEREIVERGGSTLLQGRGGTGKTLCLISRSGFVFYFELWSLWHKGQGLERSAWKSRDHAMFDFLHRLYKDYLAATHQIASEPRATSTQKQHARILFVSYSHQNQHQGLRFRIGFAEF